MSVYVTISVIPGGRPQNNQQKNRQSRRWKFLDGQDQTVAVRLMTFGVYYSRKTVEAFLDCKKP